MGRLVLAAAAWDPGWSALTWDDFTRVAIAQEWVADPQLAPDLVWLPLPMWVNGIAFALVGGAFRANPMLLTAIVNTLALFAAAAATGWSAHRISRSTGGAVLAFAAVLFSPWGLFASLSGLGEPLYYLAVTAAMAATIGWIQTGRKTWLIAASVSIAMGAAARYEGWALFGGWAVVLAYRELRPLRSGWWSRMSASRPVLAILALPAVVPVGWVILSWVRAGDPLFFARETARFFSFAYGAVHGVIPRLSYYPLSLLRAAPLLLAALAVVVVIRRRDPIVIVLTAIVGLQFGAMYASSVLSPVVGAFNERFMFAFALALVPLLGHLPAVLRSLGTTRTVAGLLAMLAVLGTAYRLADRPVEWTHAPDLLALSETLGRLGSLDQPLQIVTGPGFLIDSVPLAVRNGDTHVVRPNADLSLEGPMLDATTVWVERLPSRVESIDRQPSATVGRYRVYSSVPVAAEPCTGCSGWTLEDELGTTRPIPAGQYVAVEFTGDDPPPGAVATISRQVERSESKQTAIIQVRSLYGHGFNPGRIVMQVIVDDEVAMQRDIADHSRWVTVEAPIHPGQGAATISIAVIAQPGIETGWAWGRASTVLLRSMEMRP